jgi:glycerol-3-phosphate O-acyltransferase
MNSNLSGGTVRLLLWLASPILWMVRPRVLPEQPLTELGLQPGKSVMYVLPTKSILDLLVLYQYCGIFGLPVPDRRISQLDGKTGAAYMYLTKLGLLQPVRQKSAPLPLTDLCIKVLGEKSMEIQIVPVSIIWGRDPSKQKGSWFSMLFSDDEHAGVLQKLFIVLAQGRDAIISYGKPISLREQVDQDPNAGEVSKMLRRVLRVHFQRQRTNLLGPKIYDRTEVVAEIVRSKAVRAAIDRECEKDPNSRHKVEQKAQHYVREISAEPTHGVVRFFRIILSYVWNKIFHGIDARNLKTIHELSQTHEIVFMSTHRSHIDYLLLGYVLFDNGLAPPHMAAGINLNFWPIGGLLRRSGAFFLRRKFGGNRLYTAVFTEYLHFLLRRGHSINFFPEGGRSRTGRLLVPKTGMLSMIVSGYIRDQVKPVAIVPVYIGYDTVAEVKSYYKELQGGAKQKETIGQLLGARKIMKKRFGRAYVNFCKPVILNEFLDQSHPEWRSHEGELNFRPDWLSKSVEDLAFVAMQRINEGVLVSSVGMVAMALLTSPKRAMPESELISFLQKCFDVIVRSGLTTADAFPSPTAAEILNFAESVAPIQRFHYPGSDVLYCSENDGVSLTYYKNNIIHLFALPSLIANFFVHQESVMQDDLNTGCKTFYPFLKQEFFLGWTEAEFSERVQLLINTFIEQGLLSLSNGELRRPAVLKAEYIHLKCFAGILQSVLERYGITLAIIGAHSGKTGLVRQELESQCQLLARRISLLSGVNDPEYYDKSLYRNFVDMLIQFELVRVLKDPSGTISVSDDNRTLAGNTALVLSPDIRESINRAVHNPES